MRLLGASRGKIVRASRGKIVRASRGKIERASRGKIERASRGKIERASRGKIVRASRGKIERAIWVVLSLLRCDWSKWVTCQNDVKSMQIRSCDHLETIDLLSLLLSDWLGPKVASITTILSLERFISSMVQRVEKQIA